jgi:hypothetical protein
MKRADWAEEIARKLLEVPLPRRWTHSRGVARQARTLGPILGKDADLLEAAAWLHDIGYSPELADTGFHPLDGARYLRDVQQADDMLCRLVAHHSCAMIEAEERGLRRVLLRDFPPPPRGLAEALTYCDMTTSPDGNQLTVHDRLAEIGMRYGPGHIVTRSIERSSPALVMSAARVQRRMSKALIPSTRRTARLVLV